MPFFSVTRLRVNSILNLISFFRANENSVIQIKKSKGLMQGIELIDKKLTFWTITMWESENSMLEFRNSNSHRNAMKILPNICNEAAYCHWIQEVREFPNLNIVEENLKKYGRYIKLKNPSTDHSLNYFQPLSWTKITRKLI